MKKIGGSAVGRPTYRTRTGCPGIRFEWAMRVCGPVLRVVATWTDKDGRARRTAYSVEVHGLEEALDLAIKARTSAGAPMPDRADLLQRLRAEYATKGQR